MGPGGIATIIASCSLLIIALAIGYTIIRLSRLIDEVQKTVSSANRIVTTAENMTQKVNTLVTSLTEKNSGMLKVLGSLVSLIPSRKNNSSREHE
jgi:uncharacterized protein YoxC